MSDEVRYFEGIGRRKRAIARVRLYPGKGEMTVNGKALQQYFSRPQDWQGAIAPLKLTKNEGRFNLSAVVKGGGISGQSEAICHGVARALLEIQPGMRPLLRRGGFLTRDPREKERKKPGLKRARKAPQYTKR